MAQSEVVVEVKTKLPPVISKGFRAVIEETLILHQRMDARECLCGWDELGRSHAEHVANAIMEQL